MGSFFGISLERQCINGRPIPPQHFFIAVCLFGSIFGAPVFFSIPSHAQESDQPPLEEWQIKGTFAAFKEDNPRVWAVAAKDPTVLRVLKASGEKAKEIGPKLVQLLKHSDPQISAAAPEALGSIAEAAKNEIPNIAELLTDKDSSIRLNAVRALGAMGQIAQEQTPKLAGLLKDPDPEVRGAVVGALGYMGEATKPYVPQLVELLRNQSVSSLVPEALGHLGETAKGQAPKLVELLKDPDPLRMVPFAAAQALGAIGESAKEQAPRLIELLKDPDPESMVPSAAAQALAMMGPGTFDQIPRLIKLGQDQDQRISAMAVSVISQLGYHTKNESLLRLSEILIQYVDHPNKEVRYAVVSGVQGVLSAQNTRIDSRLVSLLGEMLLKFLKDSEKDLRTLAVAAVGSMCQCYKEEMTKNFGFKLAKQLAQNFKDAQEFEHISLLYALRALGKAAREQVPQVARFLNDPDFSTRQFAVETLSQIGPSAQDEIPKLLELFKNDPVSYVREYTADAIVKIAAPVKGQEAVIAELLNHPEEIIRLTAIRAFSGLGITTSAHAPNVLRLLYDQDGGIRAAAASAFGEMGLAASEHALALAALLNDSDQYVRQAAAKALGSMSDVSKVYAPKLAKLLRDPNPEVRRVTAGILNSLGPIQTNSILDILTWERTTIDLNNI